MQVLLEFPWPGEGELSMRCNTLHIRLSHCKHLKLVRDLNSRFSLLANLREILF